MQRPHLSDVPPRGRCNLEAPRLHGSGLTGRHRGSLAENGKPAATDAVVRYRSGMSRAGRYQPGSGSPASCDGFDSRR